METIKNYLDNIFANLPKSAELAKMREELFSNMEDKYNELKEGGKTENEAIGIVISEFGNIDELVKELGIDTDRKVESVPVVTEEQAESYMKDKNKYGKLIAVGVLLCILAPAVLIFTNRIIVNIAMGIGGYNRDLEGLSIIPLFIFIAIAVGLFIYSGINLEKYKYLEKNFTLPLYVEQKVKARKEEFASTFIISMIVGVILCVLSPITLIVLSSIDGNEDRLSYYGVIVLLIMVAIAVFIFIRIGTINNSYSVLLQIDDYSKSGKESGKENDKVIGGVAAIVWPIATAIFLVWGLVYNGWGICWIVFPITGILFGAFSGAYNIIKGDHKK